ncbi:YvrJ family protein [Defluviitalea phaphyphila]|nr:YvrJ family protein [Defluviitalea phaphyphila]
MEELFSQVANLGFPIIVSIYLLVRVEAKLDELTKSIQKLSSAISQHIN